MSLTLPTLRASISTAAYTDQAKGVRLCGVFLDADGQLVLSNSAQAFADEIHRRFAQGSFTAKAGEMLLVGEALPAVIVGLGAKADYTIEVLKSVINQVIPAMARWAESIEITAKELRPDDWLCEPYIRFISSAVLSALEPRTTMKTKGETPFKTTAVTLLICAPSEAVDGYVKAGASQAYAEKLCRWLADTPSNVATPTFLGDVALALGEAIPGLSVTVMDEDEIRALGMNAFLAVAQGSQEAPRFIVMRYQGAEDDRAPLALVGKGITFDAGGISLKPAANMWDMTYDMCGAASVIGTMAGLAQLGVKENLLGVVAACENLPSGSAVKPGDIVTSLSGRTIEILNTDAEGRLILADALTWTTRQKPALIVDMATLTGACCIALGDPYTGLFSNNVKLREALLEAGRQAADEAWALPVGPKYLKLMDSPAADIANLASKRDGGASTAAAFLETFTEKLPWAHLDIAATASVSGAKRHATGRPVPLLFTFVLNRA